jgi:DNA-directed RNA polymerase specialized sigma24 family protein
MTQELFGEAYGRGRVKTVRFLRSRGASLHDAEDLAQAAWLQGWKKIDQLRDHEIIVSWVNAIALNYHRRGIRREARYQPLTDCCGNRGVDLAPIEATKILAACRPGDRILFEDLMGGMTTAEIAMQQHVTTTAIRVRLFRARREVRERLASPNAAAA